MHCLLIITQSTLVPSPDCDCADAQRPDSAHPFPEGELWKPKTAAIPPPNFSSYAPVSPSLCFYLPLLLSGLQHGSGRASKGNAEQCEGPDRNLTFFLHMVEVCHILGGPSAPGENLVLYFSSASISKNEADSWHGVTQLNQVHEADSWHECPYCKDLSHFSG